jgi:hypothetical protein
LAGLALAAMLAGGNIKADEHITGVESVRTDVLEATMVPGAGRTATEVWIRGAGFVPETEVAVFIADGNGVLTEISVPAEERRDGGGSVYPLVANEHGAWATSWMIGRFSRPGAGAEGILSIVVMDAATLEVIATTPLALCNNEERPEGEAVPSFCSA